MRNHIRGKLKEKNLIKYTHATPSRWSKGRKRLGTWNVKPLFATGKLINLIWEVNRLKLDITAISELWWPGSRICEQNEGTLYYSGTAEDDRHHRNGVGIFVTSKFKKYVRNFVPISDKIALLQLCSRRFNTNIIQVYAPTAEKKYENEIESFYSQLNHLKA